MIISMVQPFLRKASLERGVNFTLTDFVSQGRFSSEYILDCYQIFYIEQNVQFGLLFKQTFIMQTSFRYQFRAADERPLKYVLPGNLRQKYNECEPQIKQILQATEKCPFTDIRQLIIAFKRTTPCMTDIAPCDILVQKYQANMKLRETDNQLNRCISEAEQSLIRFNKLDKVIDHYNILYDSLKNFNLTDMTQKQPKQLDYQFKYRTSSIRNEKLLQIESKYFEFVTFSQQLERALVLAGAANALKLNSSLSTSSLSASLSNFRMLSDISTKLTKKLDINLNQLHSSIFDWRELVKHGEVQPQDIEQRNAAISNWKNMQVQMLSIYAEMTRFSSWIQKDRDQARRLYDQNARTYKKFLPQYIRNKEVYQISSKNSFYHSIIREEKNLLENHLRKNYGMIVPYGPSEQFTKTIAPLQSSRNTQLKALLADELIPLEDATLYLNGQYEKLYKEVCDNRDSPAVRRKIEDSINKWTKYSNMEGQNNNFALHLIQSCQKLLRIAK